MRVNTIISSSLTLLDGVIFKVSYYSLEKIWWIMLCCEVSYG